MYSCALFEVPRLTAGNNAAQVEKPAENPSPSPEDLDGKLTGARKKTKENSLTEGLGTQMKKGAGKVDKKVKVVPSENAAQLDKNKQSPIVDVTSRVTDIPCVPKSCTRLKQDLKQLGTDIVNRWLVTLDLSFISIT